ncbi:phospholipid/glycerol acyltransferase [Gemmatirosa kalamazoonensis]|uniref:Phospholipid/glycerol acyltransferase n=1 Tax=Gemmatirosa kalamazoonensis TaxID=861299 RepID=W0R9Y8_9BACT|nr:lysophospholipid acyltransferase family protein [Gemmatirosa kalamazoonensis]AHG87621.1 phospholipid/glycerol acyltransferase [Gemmatirosa kalamazoonensis]
MQRLVSAWVWTAWVLIVLLGFPVACVIFAATAPFDPGRYAVGRWFRLLGKAAAAANPWWRIRVSGVRIDDPRRPYVAVANHESYADIMLLCYLPWEMKWLSKKTIFNIPVMGWMMRMAGDIPVVRGDRDSGLDALAQCKDRLGKRVSVMIFPEGTRSPNDELLQFKGGAFSLAVDAQVPILPIAIAGTRDAMAKHSFRVNRAVAGCRVLPPIETAGMGPRDVPALRNRVRALIDETRRQLRDELAGAPTPPNAHAAEPTDTAPSGVA